MKHFRLQMTARVTESVPLSPFFPALKNGPLFTPYPYPSFVDTLFEEVLYGAAGAAGGCAGAGTGVVRRSPVRTGGTG